MSADSTNDDSLYPIAVLIDEVGSFYISYDDHIYLNIDE